MFSQLSLRLAPRAGLSCSLLATLLLGTAASRSHAIQAGVRDSAGIRIVENQVAPARNAIAVDTSSPLRIGSRGGQVTLYRVREVRSLSDGRIVVANGLDLLWFARDGRLLARGGGAGDGPAEFREIAGVTVLPGDTVVAVNRVPPVASWFLPDGRAAKTARFVNMRGAPLRYTRLSDGSWTGLAFGGERPPATPGLFHEDWYVTRRWLDRPAADTVAKVPGEHYFGDVRRSVLVRGSPRAYMSAHGDRIAAGSSEKYEVRIFSAAGALLQIVRNSLPNPSISTVPAAQAVASSARRTEIGGTAGALEVPSAATAPAFHGVMLAKNGSLWVRRSPPSTQVAEWHVYNANGAWTATLQLPGRFRPTEIGDSDLLGVLLDELDVESVVRYRLTTLAPR